MEQTFIIIGGFIFGLLIGSFLNVVILRLPQGESIIFPASHCPKCKKNLKWWHNIPLISWLLLGGKCYYCKEPISLQYPLIELLTGGIFALVLAFKGLSIYSVVAAFVFALLLALSTIDLRYKAVPDSINLLAALLALWSSPEILDNLQNALLVAGGLSMLRFVVSYYVSKKEEIHLQKRFQQTPWLQEFYPKYIMIEAMGEGDIIVGFTIGAMVGLKLSLVTLFIAALIALPASIYSRVSKNHKELPFIPFLAIGLFLTYLFSQEISEWLDAYTL
ncbi:leader peptidase / N-methyltransferase [Nitratiruptor sp. YY08-26]|uniref:prepilin peptidase n=1 Tax=unclassified Nitratiruptor TaxID=2624044 RepID=UPI001915C877|nr:MULTISPECIES: A24 family peptidase [unclassified Nitratiruptor]BCD62014.1 leader peptidase / N-methyltransferase [Nitratiruptor sp. YY08-13]BCD65950.1 leader peptidase / N-methyltransferase [Nitratiruptor sp. YY08-26]